MSRDQNGHRMRSHFLTGQTRSYSARLDALNRLESAIRENEDLFCQALDKDLRKPKQEAIVGELEVTLAEIAMAKKNLKRWMKARHVFTPLALWPARSRIYPEPRGVALIIGAWNYPVYLTLGPLIGALAAGNCAVVKPSELAPATSRVLYEVLGRAFSPDLLQVIEGGVAETTQLLEEKFDYIFFTGSASVGKIVMRAAAKYLTPITLELGGKSPVIVSEDADLELAARRIVWGKYYNAGQTCVAPDYVYVHKSVEEQFLNLVQREIQSQFGLDAQQSSSYGRMINERHFSRVVQLISREKIFLGGRIDRADLYIEPTVLNHVSWDDPIMSEEIFGPILPVLTYDDWTQMIQMIRAQAKPLSAYLFAKAQSRQNDFIENVSFGGGCINDVMVHLGNPNLPFGGVGESGLGQYHGHDSFRTFSHEKSVMHRTGWLDMADRYAPYDDKKIQFIRRLLTRSPK